jgi:hypothetical protein
MPSGPRRVPMIMLMQDLCSNSMALLRTSPGARSGAISS